MDQKTCKHCDKSYLPFSDQKWSFPNQDFCSLSCRNTHDKAAKRAAARKTLKCPYCGTEFLQTRVDQIYCSHECGKNHHSVLKRQSIREEEQQTSKCEHCEKEFQSYFFSGTRQRFCSRKCNVNFHKNEKIAELKAIRDANPIQPRDCAFCKTTFIPSNYGNKDQRFCSKKCRSNDYKARQRAESAAIRATTIRTCPICEKQFSPKRTLKEIYCSAYCRQVIGKRIYKMMQRCYENTQTVKADHSHRVLGYSPNDLLRHLQTFQDWTTLKEAEWHLDHRFPIIAFVHKGITDPKIICCLANLQPLAGSDNCIKNDNYNQKEFDEWLLSIQVCPTQPYGSA